MGLVFGVPRGMQANLARCCDGRQLQFVGLVAELLLEHFEQRLSLKSIDDNQQFGAGVKKHIGRVSRSRRPDQCNAGHGELQRQRG